jgi:predicted transcriptional regulator/DNA-binding XRE family transcriptional regulator
MADMANRLEGPRLGAKVRGLRRRQNLSQVQLAERLGISASYLNLIESNRRPLPAGLLIKLAQQFGVDLSSFAPDEDARLLSDLLEVFADPLFEGYALTQGDVREMATSSPAAARAILALYRQFQSARASTETLAERVAEGEDTTTGPARSQVPSEEVSDFIQARRNYFPELEEGAEELWKKARLDPDELYSGMVRYLDKHQGVHVRVARWGEERGILRRYDPEKKLLVLSELLPTRSRTFQVATQIGLLTQHQKIDRLAESDPNLAASESRALARMALASYFAGAVLMPYERFLRAAQEERYDVDVIGRRFRVGFEQVCHRVTTLRRPGAEGIPFHMIRIDVAGNISKRFSGSGIRFARFSGACPRWNIFQAFATPGMIRIQISRMPDGQAYFCISRTIHKDSGGYHAQQPVQAIGLGCQIEYAREIVYSDGVDLDNLELATPVGVTCRVCERTDCEQRAFPSLRHPLQVDENVRAASLYSPATRLPLLQT